MTLFVFKKIEGLLHPTFKGGIILDGAERRKIVVERRVAMLRRNHERQLMALLSTLCFLITVCLGKALSGGKRGSVPGLYGSTLLFEESGGYVLVAVIPLARQW